ncbi:MAG: hypothetical protein CVU89_06150 [Firmicutes bacterium HGW-Firmicutes-14]|nr:MAG: hypothetical protein CVU89_06150 [Firmicutes bacterium HGW-Firmicutes-14]
MMQALWSASSGMLAQQTAMDNVANNLANVNTNGYKKSRTEFQDLLYSQVRDPGLRTGRGQVVQNGVQVGTGTRPAATQMLFEQGSLQPTGNVHDFALFGNGFFEILLPDGSRAYTRDGSFKIDADGYMVTSEGYIVNMDTPDGGLVTFAGETSEVVIDKDGKIYQEKELLQLEPYTFTSPGDLEQVEPGMFRPTEESGEAVLISEMEYEEDDEYEYDEDGNLISSPEKKEYQAYYEVMLPSGETAFTTENSFRIDEEGRLVTANKGYPLEPEVYVDLEAEDNTLKSGDLLSADIEGAISMPVEAGRLNIVTFPNPAGLEKAGGNLYIQTENSGAVRAAGDFTISQGFLESSNVQLADEMVSMMLAQRAYELCSRSIRTSDEMLGKANELLRR